MPLSYRLGCLHDAKKGLQGGLWSLQEWTTLYINCLKLLAGTLAVKTFAKDLTNVHVHMRMDNNYTAVACE